VITSGHHACPVGAASGSTAFKACFRDSSEHHLSSLTHTCDKRKLRSGPPAPTSRLGRGAPDRVVTRPGGPRSDAHREETRANRAYRLGERPRHSKNSIP